MGDKSPKNKQREKDQKSAAKTQTKSDLQKRQASFSAAVVKDTMKTVMSAVWIPGQLRIE